MRYLPHTREDTAAMLAKVGVESMEELFASIPADCRRKEPMNLPAPMSELELNAHMDALAADMAVSPQYKVFIGAGSYSHFIPEAIKHLLLRSEVYTAYTPYQPEISQGTLQTIYEYQTLIARLLGMEIANASMYDGATALAEALLMAVRITRRKKVALSSAIHPLYRRVVASYLASTNYEVIEIPFQADGRSDLSALDNLEMFAAVALQSPNFFGCVEDLRQADKKIHADSKTLMIACFTEPLAYGVLKSPGNYDADIVCGEGQSLGIPRAFGGPGLGILASKKKYVRNMPGRLIGKSVDKDGQRGFVLTLATREQHIRREKATSNICSNQGLCATAATMYMAMLGGTGFRELAALNHDKAEYLKTELRKAGSTIVFDSPIFNEFVVQFPAGSKVVYHQLLEKKIVGGLPLESYYPEMADRYLLCATETSSKADMDALVKEVTSCTM
jgi:glycine dehydrogenase subunit 1